MMLIEAFVFSGYERLEEDGVDGVVGHGSTVLVEELAQQFAVGAVNLGGGNGFGMNDVVDRG